jgi:hypothetical protein
MKNSKHKQKLKDNKRNQQASLDARESVIRSLKCFSIVQEMLIAGEKISKIADYIWEKETLKEKISITTLRAYLQAFVENNKDIYALRYPSLTLSRIKKSVTKDDYIDPLDTYQYIVAVQMERLMINFKKELSTGNTIPQTDKCMQMMNSILKNQASIETDRTIRYAARGINTERHLELPERLQAVRDRVTNKYGHRASDALANPDTRRKLLNVLEVIQSKTTSAKVKQVLSDKLERMRALDVLLDDKPIPFKGEKGNHVINDDDENTIDVGDIKHYEDEDFSN